MNNNIIKHVFAATLLVAAGWMTFACSNEEDDIFDQSAAERLNAVSSIYSQRLTQSKGGWVMEYYPYDDNEDLLTGIGYLIVNRFHDNGAVFTAMKNAASYNTLWTDSSAWQVVTYMGPVLTFNTYNRCLGRFSDPNDIDLTTGRYDDESGQGFQGDYEFVMVDVPENGEHIMLKGVKRGLYQRLTRLPEGTDYEAYLDSINAFRSNMFVKDARWELVMTDNGKRFRMNHQDRGCSTVYPEGSDSTTYGWHEPFLVTKYDGRYHLRFKDTVMYDNVQMEQEYVYEPDDDKFYGVKNAENTIEGIVPAWFFIDNLTTIQTRRWQFDTNSNSMSESMATLYNSVVQGFKASNFTYNSTNFMVRDSVINLRMQYRSGRTTSYVYYAYSISSEGDNITLKYDGPIGNGETVLNAIPAAREFLEFLSHTFVVSADTRFNLNQVRLTSATEPDKWFYVTLY